MSETEVVQETVSQMSSLAQRLKDNPGFVAWALDAYRKQGNLTDSALAKQLGTSEVTLVRLALCKRPESASPQFAAQIRQIAAYTQIDPTRLANLLRQVESLEELSKQPQVAISKATEARQIPLRSGLLAAARDREETEETNSSETDTEDRSKTG